MAISIHTNSTSTVAQRQLGKIQSNLAKSMNALSSGYRINSAADDAAGMAVSQTMDNNVMSFHAASRNSNDAISMIQTAESALDELQGMIVRMRELAIQSASDGIDDTQRGYVNKEVVELQSEIDRISGVTKFNGTSLLDGNLRAVFQVGLNKGDTFGIDITAHTDGTTALGFTVAGLGIDATAVNLSTRAGAENALAALDAGFATIINTRATLGAKENRLDSVINNLSTSAQNLAAASGRIKDVDVASEMANLTKNQVLQQVSTSMLTQANSSPQIALALLGG